MRSFIRPLFRRRRPRKAPNQPNQPNQNVITPVRAMSTGAVSAILYACTFSTPTSLGAVPEDSEAKAHHLKGGNGFKNTWDSYREWGTGQIMRAMAWLVQELNPLVLFRLTQFMALYDWCSTGEQGILCHIIFSMC
jgi:hypothetical protein